MASIVKRYDAPPINRAEILRYAGFAKDTSRDFDMAEECINEISGRLVYKICYMTVKVSQSEGVTDLEFMKTESQSLGKRLSGCREAVVFVATVGIEIDRLIAKYSVTSPAKALLFQAIGAERVESLADAFEKELSQTGSVILKERFSPGYGDLPIECQREIFSALDCSRKIGVSLNESLLMSPSKSISAIIGVLDNENKNN